MGNDVEKRITAKMVLDSSGFNSSLQGVNQQLKVAQSELKASSTQVGVFGKESDKLKVTSEGLSKQIELQRQKVDIYKDSIEKSTQKLQDTIKARDELKNKLQEESARYNEVIKLYGKESDEAKKAKESVDNLTEEYKKKEKQVESTAKTINNYTVNMNKADAELAKMQGELQKTNKELATHESKLINAGKAMENASEKIKSSGEKISSVGNKLSIGVTAPLIGIGIAASNMAMEAVESENLFEVSMGNMADSARQWSDDLNKSLGLNAYEVRKNVGTLNAMLISMGQTEKASYNMSTGLTKLAYDMASFYNLSPEQAFEKLRAGISGESEPLKQLGIVVSDTAIQQYALEKGLVRQIPVLDAHGKAVKDAFGKVKMQNEEMSDAVKVQARYGLIMQNTVKAQGDLARTMDSPTNKLRIQTEQIKQQAIEFGTKLIPLVEKGMSMAKPIIDWLASLNDEQKEQIIKLGLLAAAAGPVLSIGGKIVSLGGSVVGVVGKLSGVLGKAAIATEGVGAAAEVAAGAGGLAGLGTAIGGTVVAAAPWIAAIGAVGVGLFALDRHMRQSSIPTVQLFGKETSENTKTAVKGYLDLDDNATKALMDLQFKGSVISKDTANNLTTTFNNMGTQIKTGMDKHYQEQLSTMQDFFKNSAMLSDKEEADILSKMNEQNEFEKNIVTQGTQQIDAILKKASDEKRKTTVEEENIIKTIQQNMKTDAIKALSETELESKAILERMKLNTSNITAQQVADVVKKSAEQRDKAVQAANDQADKIIKEAIRQRDEKHTITADEANKIIESAEAARRESVRKAEDMHYSIVDEAKKQASEHVTQVDWETGQIKSKWQIFKDWWNGLSFVKHSIGVTGNPTNYATGNNSYSGSSYAAVGHNATGSSNWQGGLTTMHEQGYEVYDLPRGTRIYNHEASEDLALKTAEKVAQSILNNIDLKQNGVQTLITPVYLDGERIAYVENKIQGKNLAFTGRSSGI